MDLSPLLPIGSVVLLKEGNKRVMIVGRLQRQARTDKVWDYSACYYPEGVLNPDELFLFNHDQIQIVFFLGFQDKEGLEFQKVLTERYDTIKNSAHETAVV